MACTTAESVDEQKKLLTMSIRNEIVRDLVTQNLLLNRNPTGCFVAPWLKNLSRSILS